VIRHVGAKSVARAAANQAGLVDAASSVLTAPLVVPDAELLLEGEQGMAVRAARLSSPEAVAERERSRTAYAGLGASAAVQLAEQVFEVQRPSYTPPGEEGGAHIATYLSQHAAQQSLPSGQRLLLTSTIPLRSTIGSGQLAPVSLSLDEGAAAYAPANPLVPVSISKTAAGGVSFPYEVSVAPVQSASAEASVVTGDHVVFPNTAPDTDFMVEPSPAGAELSWQLRSEGSPADNALRFTLPAGDTLRMSTTVPGAAEVVREGQAVFVMPPAMATDAQGVPLQVTYAVSGDVLDTHVDLGESVAYPVMVDPLIVGFYGEYENANVWSGWHHAENGCGCFGFPEYAGLLQAGTNPTSYGYGYYGEWYINALGDGDPGEAGIARVDILGMTHALEGQSDVYAGMYEAHGPFPDGYSFNGYGGISGYGDLVSSSNYENVPVAFCADATGQPEPELCNEKYSANAFFIADMLTKTPQSWYNYIQFKGADVQYLDTTAPNAVHVENLPTWWTKDETTAAYIHAEDEGTGIQAFRVEIPPGHTNAEGQPFFAESSSCSGEVAFYGCPHARNSGVLGELANLPTGVYELEATAYDAVGNYRRAEVGPDGEERQNSGVYPKFYVDKTPPTISLSGSLSEANGKIVGEGSYTLNVTAKDGSPEAPQSGTRWVAIDVDGKQVDEFKTACERPAGIPAAGCYELSGAWTFEGQKYGAGPHTITVVAEDWVGNVETTHLNVTVNTASYEAVGPGAVNLHTGDYMLSASDVSIAAANATLTVSRTYDSRNLTQGMTGPLGSQWVLSMPDSPASGVWRSLLVMPNESVWAVLVDGQIASFTSTGSKHFSSPAGYKNDILTGPNSSGEYELSDAAGAATLFAKGASSGEYVPSAVVEATGAGGLNKLTYKFATSEGITEPTKVLAPYPSSINCLSELVKGCRALEFKYAGSTTAEGESESQWKEYKGRLAEVTFVAWNGKEMAKTPVARYAYDAKGRLRAEWNPGLEASTDCHGSCTALKTTYGYDAEGHVVSLTAPGQETWAFTYGTIAGDANTGRLLKVTRAPASAPLWKGEALSASSPPVISGTPAVGVQLGVSSGKWSGDPVAYSYQWQDCNTSGSECTAIAGAINGNYTPTSSDVGHKLVVGVTAINGEGSVATSSSASGVVASTPAAAYTQTIDAGHSINAVSCIAGSTTCVVSDSAGQALYTTHVSATAEAGWTQWAGPGGQSPSQAVDCPSTALCVLADGKGLEGGNLYYATSLGGAFSEAFSPTYGADAISCASASFCVDAQDYLGYYRYSTDPTSSSWTAEEQGEKVMKAVSCLSSSFCAIADSNGRVHIATSTSEIESSTWKETDVDGQSALNGIACTSVSTCVAVDSSGDVLKLAVEGNGAASATKYDIDGSTSLTAVTCTGTTTCVAVDSAGNIFVSTSSGETWTKDYSLGDDLTSVSCASSTLCVAADTEGKVIAFDYASDGTAGEVWKPQAGETVEYDVPLSGSTLHLQNMSESEVSKWGQKDDPTSATAILPPEKPQTWPATSYEGATVYYLDGEQHTVNVAGPTGGVATAEYESQGNIKRSLSADDRAVALKESCEGAGKCASAEKADSLSTENTYNAEGTELERTLGPEHKIKQVDGGAVVQARKQVTYSYEENAPSGGPYHLVTNTTEAAIVAGKEEEKHTIKDAYSGQQNLGWKLHEPTSETTAPGGLSLIHSTVYSPTTGAELETTSPAVNGGGTHAAPVYSLQFGEKGSGSGQLNTPRALAARVNGEVWVVDTENSRLEVFSAAGAFLASYGSHGGGAGQLSAAAGIAINPTTGDVYVADSGNERVDEYSSAGTFIRAWGWGVSNGEAKLETCTTSCEAGQSGSGEGQFTTPTGIAIDTAGNVYVTDSGNDRIEKFSAEGAYLAQYGSAGSGIEQFKDPTGITYDDGDLYVIDSENDRVEQLTEAGEYVAQWGSQGTGNGQFTKPSYIAANPVTAALYVSDEGNERVQQFTINGAYVATFGASGSGAGQLGSGGTPVTDGVAVSATGAIYVADTTNDRVEEWQPVPPAPIYTSQFGTKGSENGQLKEPRGVDVTKGGNLLVLDTSNGRVQEFSPAGKYEAKFGAYGGAAGDMKEPLGMAIDAKGNIWIADTGNNRVDEFNEKHEFVQTFGFGVSNGEEKLEVCASTCKAGIAGAGTGQFKEAKGIAVTTAGTVYVSDGANNRVEEFNEKGEFLAAFGFGVSNEKAEYEICTSSCKGGIAGSGNGQFNAPRGVAVSPTGQIWVADDGNNRVEEFNEEDKYLSKFGSKGTGNGQLDEPKGIDIAASGDILVANGADDRVQEFTPSGTVLATVGGQGAGNGQFEEPWGIAVTAAGAMYVADIKNNRIEEFTPAPTSGNEGAHISQTIYYTPGTEASIPTCQDHPEWANLPCETTPAHQPEVPGAPELATTTYTYNIYDEPEVTKSTSSGATRTETDKYDSVGRLASKLTTSSKGEPLPEITDTYSAETGELVKQTAGSGSEEESLSSEYNSWGQLAGYTDANGNTATYKYDGYGRLEEASDAKGYQHYEYEEATGELATVKDSAAKAFTATYDPEGKLLSESYPNGMTATYAYNPEGAPTSVEYVKTSDCTSECTWYFDDVTPSIFGQWLTQTSTLSTNNYAYDEAGRLTEVQDTPIGKTCTTRVYGYDEDGNRTSLTTYPANTEDKCSTTTTAITQTHRYDTADRLLDPGITYNAFGDIETLPAADAGTAEPGTALTSTYYADGQTAILNQEEQGIAYKLDPGRRIRETIGTGKKTQDAINHYDGPGATPSWIAYTSGDWTRNIPGINGSLAAVEYNTESPILQIVDLHGDIVGTASMSETATKPESMEDMTEYGVPTTTTPPKYSWLGAGEFPTELSSGIGTMGARTYVPEIGRFLQPDPSPGGSANAYAYTHGNPLNESDPSGEWSLNETSGGVSAAAPGEGIHEGGPTGIAAGAIMPPPVNEAAEAAFWANPPWDQDTAGTEEYEEYEEWGEEEGGYEGVAYHPGTGGQVEGHVEEALLYQPLGDGSSVVQVEAELRRVPPRCLKLYAESEGKGLSSNAGCMRYAGLFGEIVGGIEKVAKGGWKVIKHAASNVWHWVKTHASLVKTIDCDISGGGAGVLAGAGASVFTDNLYIAGAIGSAVAAGVTYACEHQSHGF
jgi:RHS repeat-associated protein